MSALGIYFGTKVISIVETMGRRVLNNIKIPLSTVSLGELEEKVPDEIKIVALIKEELRKRRISAKEVTIALTGRDLIIRTFEMPILPLGELKSAVTFEAKKYIPFKVEDLVSDSQFKLDKSTRGNLVLYMGLCANSALK
jgi:type IV pilus assembly protein PilM